MVRSKTMRGSILSNLFLAAALVAGVVATPVRADGQTGATDGEWRFYGGDAGSTRYSPLDQINRDNVADLEIKWRWKADNFGPRAGINSQVTPLMVDGVLYATAGSRRDVVAIDAATGETLWMWRIDEGLRGEVAPRKNHRGVSYWTDGASARIIYITPGYRLISLDAKTGRPDPAFGTDGIVDLFEGLDRPRPRDGLIGASSPPIIVKNVAVVGGALSAFAPTKENIAGFVRGYDVKTGERRWIFHTVPLPGEFGNETWENDSWRYTGNTAVWAPMSADLELGYVYLPVETPTNDLFGGDRPGNNLFAESLVCLDAETGERVWHFQFVHHGIWDWDIPAAPMLIDVTVDGRPIKAVAQVTKQAWTYVFDRVTGEPIWPIEERPVMQSTVPGEQTAATNPMQIVPRIPSGQTSRPAGTTTRPQGSRSRGERTAPQGCGAMGPLGLPLVKPPWGRITAIDLNTGEHVWMVPNGDTPDCVKNHPALDGLDIPPTGKAERGGILVTKTLVFAGEGSGLFAAPRGSGGPMFRAYDKQSGKVIAELELPANQSGLPMTYMTNGTQYIVMAVSGRGHPSELVAIAVE